MKEIEVFEDDDIEVVPLYCGGYVVDDNNLEDESSVSCNSALCFEDIGGEVTSEK